MTERNPYSQYSFDSYDQRRNPRRIAPEAEGILGRLQQRISKPVFAAFAVVVTVVALVAIIALSYPGQQATEDLPIIRADAGDIRIAPPEGGGVEMPHRDSTVFSSIRPAELNETPPVENLAASEAPVNKLDAFAKEAEQMFAEGNVEGNAVDATKAEPASGTEITESIAVSEESEVPDAAEEVDVLAAAAKTAETKTLAVKTEKISPADLMAAAERGDDVVSTDTPTQHPAGAAPDTLAYVQSILDEKDGKAAGVSAGVSKDATKSSLNTKVDTTQPAVQKIEPAAGAAARAPIKPGSFFVQLGSVTDESKATGESARLSKSYSGILQGASVRVQRADLGEKGIRFRIQAGPMAKDSAVNLCNEIKVQKPGGCIVVQ